jgi:outer membrane immunogenic protein
MKFKVLSLALAVNALSGIAIADTVTTPAPSSTAATKSTYDWTGVYVGGFVGGASGANATSSVARNVMVDGIIGRNTSSSSNYSLNSSFIGGGTVGY